MLIHAFNERGRTSPADWATAGSQPVSSATGTASRRVLSAPPTSITAGPVLTLSYVSLVLSREISAVTRRP